MTWSVARPMCVALADQFENGCDHTTHRGDFASIGFARGRERVVVAEQLPGPINEVNVHAGLEDRITAMQAPVPERDADP